MPFLTKHIKAAAEKAVDSTRVAREHEHGCAAVTGPDPACNGHPQSSATIANRIGSIVMGGGNPLAIDRLLYLASYRIVYIFGTYDDEKEIWLPPSKIGITTKKQGEWPEEAIKRRLKQLKCGNPGINCCCYEPAGHDVEAAMHRGLREHRTHGEWFNVSGPDVCVHLHNLASMEREGFNDLVKRTAHFSGPIYKEVDWLAVNPET